MKKKISAVQRRHQDYLRRKGLAVGQVYAKRLYSLRRKEVKRCLELCGSYDDATLWPRIFENSFSEAGYLQDWYSGLYLAAGIPQCASTIRDLKRKKASDADAAVGVFENALKDYANRRCGSNIVSVSGTLRDELIDILNEELTEDVNIGIEKFTKKVMKRFNPLATWQVRRIAQTETMIGLAEAGAIAAADTEVRFLKEWCISGVGNTRDTHMKMDGVTVGQDEYFVLEDCRMLYPHDNSLNPPAGEIINCACSCIRIPI